MAKTIKIFNRPVTPDQAQELLHKHHEAFSQSACQKCPGLCCQDCASSDGYLYRDDVSEEEIQEYKARFGWNAKTGFKTAKGCALPLIHRSTTCASFYCEQFHLNNKFADELLAKRRQLLGPVIKGVNIFEVADKVENLRKLMENTFD